MDPNRRYISRVSTNGMIGGYTDYRSVNPYAGYTTPVYPGYQVINRFMVLFNLLLTGDNSVLENLKLL